ncbi:DNA cytosine methyltransferase [Streptomyces sp. NPDC051287]|uniref:Cytosine-specific methyltransferase n=1 Tax=Streptomyces evansiae TaxID=3075535 RepID=A0ABD5EE13_9ACTN|nr:MULTISPECIES: DNA cytosine methyltransferase [unclassified Streptomyces]EFL01110.1 DNA cytocine methyl transferase [Streptomyces sp. SPB78]MDT0419435.1 DNA cytosine methyltransferase [Streptomyces sp. DSM 41982]
MEDIQALETPFPRLTFATVRGYYFASIRGDQLASTGAYTVVDLFSGGGGMSYGFHAHPSFEMRGAADVEVGKPSTGHGAIGCNATYEANIGVKPMAVDLAAIEADELAAQVAPPGGVDVLLACPPCTGFSRAVSKNWAQDDPRNSLVARVADHVAIMRPKVVLMENVPQLLTGNFRHHFHALKTSLEGMGYTVRASSHILTKFGLPQQRERALVVATASGLPAYTLEDLWHGYSLREESLTVRRAIGHLPAIRAGEKHPHDENHTSSALAGESLARIAAIPHDGGSWADLLRTPETEKYLIPSMRKAIEAGRLNAYSDVYGRMYWHRPAPTIKRECSHVGNGRYAHPEQDRLCTVRELAILNGFPENYKFIGSSRKNLYRQIGDAVPPLVSFQLAHVTSWILDGEAPDVKTAILPGTSLRAGDLVAEEAQLTLV